MNVRSPFPYPLILGASVALALLVRIVYAPPVEALFERLSTVLGASL